MIKKAEKFFKNNLQKSNQYFIFEAFNLKYEPDYPILTNFMDMLRNYQHLSKKETCEDKKLQIGFIFLFLNLIMSGCEKNDEMSWKISPDSKSSLIQNEGDGIVFKFCLLNKQGESATIFNKGNFFPSILLLPITEMKNYVLIPTLLIPAKMTFTGFIILEG